MKNNRVIINATFTHDNPTGQGVYTYELTSRLLEANCDLELSAYSNSRRLKGLYPDKVSLVSDLASPGLGFRGHLMRFIWLQTVLRLKTDRESLIYSTVPEGVIRPACRQIITMHDIQPIKYPEFYPKMKYHFYYNVPAILKDANAIICVSENTKKDIVDYYGIKDKAIYVIYGGYDPKKFYPDAGTALRQAYGLTRYLLYVGEMRSHKNLERSLQAFARLRKEGLKFAIVGKKDPRFYLKIEKKVAELSLRDRVVFLGYVANEDLRSLYSNAEAFIFPSLYEGFGLPPLEAMACGCPVIASSAASIPEVCGDAACYVDPHSVESIARGMNSVLEDRDMRRILIQKGLERARTFSWERSATEHLKVFEEVLNSGKR